MMNDLCGWGDVERARAQEITTSIFTTLLREEAHIAAVGVAQVLGVLLTSILEKHPEDRPFVLRLATGFAEATMGSIEMARILTDTDAGARH
ncbi:MAG TPA: hypothetical protein VNJ04_06685 [Gemmatimonadaceae bacterium]|nr:hypothetical protein [Gemmatimonadaceae bacterium]